MADIPGLVLLTPSSVSSGTGSISIAASGKVTFSSCTSIQINGCFSATYTGYIINMSGGDGDIDLQMRMRGSGTDESSSNYDIQRVRGDNTTIDGTQTANTNIWQLGTWPAARSAMNIYLWSPANTEETLMYMPGARSKSGAYINDYASALTTSTAYDGFSVYVAAAVSTMTGQLTIYGMNQ